MSEQTQLDTFRKLCENHDLTYDFSDDSSCWRRGEKQYAEILAVAKTLTREEAVGIWNEVTTKKMIDPKPFLWSV